MAGRVRLSLPLVVHISADYPDALAGAKTTAISALVEGVADHFAARVYSLNRQSSPGAWLVPGRLEFLADDGTVATCRYGAPPAGLRLRTAMERVARAIAADLAARGLRPALIQGHKLSIEGIAAAALARQLGVPYVLTLQGNTDQKVLGARPDLRSLHRRVWQDAAGVMAFAPWTAQWCASLLGERDPPASLIPCLPGSDRIIAPVATAPLVRTAFHLDHWRNKNIAVLARAIADLSDEFPGLELEIAGAGSAAATAQVDRILSSTGLSGRSRRIGAVPREAIQDWMNGAAVFALPSRRESFGMVFAEAALAGCPIVYPRGAAVDGWFPDCGFALAANAVEPESVANALRDLLRNNAAAKAGLAAWQAGPAAREFTREVILGRYRAFLTEFAA